MGLAGESGVMQGSVYAFLIRVPKFLCLLLEESGSPFTTPTSVSCRTPAPLEACTRSYILLMTC